MKTLTVGKFKSDFSKVIKDIENGEEIIVEFGKSHKKIAILVPYQKYNLKKRKIGILEGKASFKMKDDFKMTTEELLSL
ncbi:MAG TPA: prevent-host-death protein [Spirochaetota bacterium]|nr:prevent-host-death protein [Spirochaetota bacterium]HPY88940.1 prevent-host-death protein [Spirochaetota bacterium]